MSDWTAAVLKTVDVNPVYGFVTGHRMDPQGSGKLVVDVSIPPAEDLLLPYQPPQPFCFQLHVPPGFPEPSGVPIVSLISRDQVSLLEPLLVRGGASIVESSGAVGALPRLVFSWLDTAKYGLGVWVFAVRSLLVSPDYKLWYTPPPFLRSFTTKGVDRRPLLLLCGAGAAKGRRPYMEDVHCFFPSVNISGGGAGNICSVFGVLDGHGGVECSRFAVEELPPQIVASLRAGLSSSQALFNAFTSTDEEFINSTSSKAGTTATVLLWNHATGIANLANAGDSRAVVSRAGVAVDAARDMKASDSCEIARIAKAGGHVSNGRVNGSLAIARAIGDKLLKKGSTPALTAEPEIVTFRFQAQDEFMLLASDGLWDVMTSQAAVDMAADMMSKNEVLASMADDGGEFRGSSEEVDRYQAELNRIGDFMANNACNVLNSQDNITVMLVVVKRHSTESQQRDGFLYPETRLCPENHPRSQEHPPVGAAPTVLAAGDSLWNREVDCAGTVLSDQDLGGYSGSSFPFRDVIEHSASTVVEAALSRKGSVDDEDDVMSFLMDDSNF